MIKHILVGITGGVAAYKSVTLVRLLQAQGYQVRIVMTENAKAFISPLTLQAASSHRVYSHLIDSEIENSMAHIELAKWADLMVVAPATANFVAKCANGFADDLLSTLCMVTKAPLYMAPAMNCQMWAHPSTQANVNTLKDRGVKFIGPAAGELACGDLGPGRMTEPDEIASFIFHDSQPDSFWQGKKVLITAGPTFEAIDPIRYLGNKSSGRMGYALAQAAHDSGAYVTLVSGPTHLPAPLGIKTLYVESAIEMHDVVMLHVNQCDVFIGAAAVANYRLANVANQKIKASGASLQLNLVKNPDIIADVAARNKKPLVVGFAAETEHVLEAALDKLTRKKLDIIIANQVGFGQGMGVDTNAATLITANGHQKTFPESDKCSLAKSLLQEIKHHY